MVRALLLTWMILPVFACDTAERRCEHARDVAVTMWQEAAAEAVASIEDPASRKQNEESAGVTVERGRGRFVAACTALPPEAQACIARMEEIAAATRERRTAEALCTGPDASACKDAARDQYAAHTKECNAQLEPFYRGLFRD